MARNTGNLLVPSSPLLLRLGLALLSGVEVAVLESVCRN